MFKQSQTQCVKINEPKQNTFQDLFEMDIELRILEEYEKETRSIKEALDTTIELQNQLKEQLQDDDKKLDSIELHIINCREKVVQGTKELKKSEENVASYINPFRNILNIIKLLPSWSKK